MKILIIHQYFLDKGQGGGSRFNQFAKFWAETGHEVTVIAGMVHYATGKKQDRWQGKFIVEETEREVKVIRTHVSEQYNKSFLGRLWGYFSFIFSSGWAILRLKTRPDVVIATSPPLFTGVSGIIAGMRFKCPFVFEVRDLWPESAIETGVLKNKLMIKASFWLEKIIYKKAAKINVLTPAFKEAIVAKGISSEKIWMIPNGADLELFKKEEVSADIRAEYNWVDKFVVLYIGAHGVANNLEQLVFAAEKLRDELPQVLIVLVGDGMEKEKLISLAKEKGLTNISFIPPQPKEKIKDFVYASDVGIAVLKNVKIFKTVYPNKIFDYMACAKPVILGIDGVAKDLVLNQANCGVYCEPENVDELAETIKMYYRNSDLRKEHGENGYKFVKVKFNRQILASEYLTKLIGLNKNPKPNPFDSLRSLRAGTQSSKPKTQNPKLTQKKRGGGRY